MTKKNVITFMLLGSVLLSSVSAWAIGELRPLYKGARAMSMGNAFTAVADDEQCLFVNPAGLAGIQKNSMQYMAVDLDGSYDIFSSYQNFTSSSNFNGATVNQMIGKNVYGRATLLPNIVMPNIGFAIIADAQAAFEGRNQSLPQVQVGYQFTNGIVAGYGVSLAGKSKKYTNQDIRLGLGFKVLWRRGGYKPLSMTQLLMVGPQTLSEIAPSYAMGMGYDLGLQYVKTFKGGQFNIGASWLDISDTDFSESSDPILSSVNFGMAYQFKMRGAGATIAYDYKNAFTDTDWRKKNHFGLELNLPVVNISTGLSQNYLSYGVAFDFWLARIRVLSYQEELGTVSMQDGSRRYVLHAAVKFGI